MGGVEAGITAVVANRAVNIHAPHTKPEKEIRRKINLRPGTLRFSQQSILAIFQGFFFFVSKINL